MAHQIRMKRLTKPRIWVRVGSAGGRLEYGRTRCIKGYLGWGQDYSRLTALGHRCCDRTWCMCTVR